MKQKTIRTILIFAGIALVVIAAAVWIFPRLIEAFENVTGKSTAVVVESDLATLTAADTLRAIGSIEKGTYNDSFAVSSIQDPKGTTLWKRGDTAKTDTTKSQYKLIFPTAVTLAKVEKGGTDSAPIFTQVEVFKPALAKALPNVTYVGEDFTTPFVVVEGQLSVLTDPYFRNMMGTFGATIGANGKPTPVNLTLVSDAKDTSLWKTDDPWYDLSGADMTDAKKTLAKKTDKYKLTFDGPLNLTMFRDQLSRKVPSAKYIGLSFTDTPPQETSYQDILSAAPSASAAGDGSVPEAVKTAFLNSYDEREAAGLQDNSVVSPTYTDAKAKPTTASSELVITATSAASAPAVVTNRFKIRGKYSTLVRPEMIRTFEVAGGKTADGVRPKVVEILNDKNIAVWPADSLTAPYKPSDSLDANGNEIFIIGYDLKVDVPNIVAPYITKYMPSITFLNPAMPRT